ncbi:MAG: addiction module protein [Deferribacteres bacterium]|nr:addiction module protein [candidate division KSB1 bacterium]MCB9501654.1 addiction module protein [Deferribacteres bacterium]
MLPNEILQAVKKLDLSEKLLLVEDIWDNIASSNATIPLHEWQRKELAKRYKEYTSGKMAMHDWQSVHDELRDKYK